MSFIYITRLFIDSCIFVNEYIGKLSTKMPDPLWILLEIELHCMRRLIFDAPCLARFIVLTIQLACVFYQYLYLMSNFWHPIAMWLLNIFLLNIPIKVITETSLHKYHQFIFLMISLTRRYWQNFRNSVLICFSQEIRLSSIIISFM